MGLHDRLEELRELMDEWSIGAATPKTVERVNELLRDDGELREYVSRYLMDDALIRHASQMSVALEVYRDSQLFPTFEASRREETNMPSSFLRRALDNKFSLLGLAGLAACILVGLFLLPQSEQPVAVLEGPPTTDRVDEGGSQQPQFAVLTQSIHTKWITGDRKPGATFGSEKIKIERGLLQLEFFSGATVVVEGPAELDLVSPFQAICRHGKARVLAPPQAHGFTISTPDMDVVDLGTEFAIQVGDEGRSQVHVLDGEVSIRDSGQQAAGSDRTRILKGRTASFSPGEKPRVTLGDSPAEVQHLFVGSKQLSEMAAAGDQARLEEWAKYSHILRTDPATILYCDFQSPSVWSRVLPIDSMQATPPLDGAIVGAQWSVGKWPGKSALQFRGTSDRVRLSIPGRYDSVTFLAWVRVDEIERTRNSLLLTDGWEPGEIHWQLDREGALILGVSDRYGETSTKGVYAYNGADYGSPPLIGPDELGQWVFLATVFDAEAREVRHYFDGQRKSTEPIRAKLRKVRFGAAEIGNWSPLTQKHYLTRGFHGRMDELAVLSRVMSDEEIEKVYRIGKP